MIKQILDKISEYIIDEQITENIEITIEVNPGTITKQKLLDYKKSGINRLSIGLQSTNNKLLKQINNTNIILVFLI